MFLNLLKNVEDETSKFAKENDFDVNEFLEIICL